MEIDITLTKGLRMNLAADLQSQTGATVSSVDHVGGDHCLFTVENTAEDIQQRVESFLREAGVPHIIL